MIDSSGQPRVALVADGAIGGHVYTAVRKGLAALAFGESTSKVSIQSCRQAGFRRRESPPTWCLGLAPSPCGEGTGS